MSECKYVLRQIMARAIDAQQVLNDIASNPAFEPQDRARVDDISRALSESLLDASNWLKRADKPTMVDLATLSPGDRVMVDFNGDFVPCILERVTDDGMAVVRDEYNGDPYTVEISQIQPWPS